MRDSAAGMRRSKLLELCAEELKERAVEAEISSSFPFSRLLAREAQCWLEEADSGPQVSQLSCTLPPTTVPSDNEILRLEMTLDVQRMSSLCLLESFRIALSSVSSSDGHPARLLLGPDESTDTNVAVNRTVPIAVGSAATLLLVFLLALCLYSALSSSSKKKHTKSEGAIEGKVSPVVNDGNPAIPQDVLDDSHGVVGDGVLTLKPQHSAIASVDDAIAAPRRPSVANDVLQELLQPLPSAHSSIVHVQGKRRRRRSQHAHHIGTGTTQLEGRDQCDTRVTSTRPREPSELIPAVDELSESNPLNPAVVDLDVNVKCAKGPPRRYDYLVNSTDTVDPWGDLPSPVAQPSTFRDEDVERTRQRASRMMVSRPPNDYHDDGSDPSEQPRAFTWFF